MATLGKTPSVAFIGMGHYGQALASLVEHNGLDYDYAEPDKLLSKPADLVFLTVPTQFMREALQANKAHIAESSVIVNAAKGIEEGTHLMAHQIVFGVGNYRNYYSLIGPSFAEEIVDKQPSLVSLGYKDAAHIKAIQEVLQTPYFRVEPAKGFRALELASAMKNLYAITCGYARGVGFGANTHALLVTRAVQEFKQLAKAMHFADYDPLSAGVVGDLVLTCGSENSRNFRFGVELSKGTQDKWLKMTRSTVEGFHTSHSINVIAREHGVSLPLAKLTSQIINDQSNGLEHFSNFLGQR